jgi:hypothetical protein
VLNNEVVVFFSLPRRLAVWFSCPGDQESRWNFEDAEKLDRAELEGTTARKSGYQAGFSLSLDFLASLLSSAALPSGTVRLWRELPFHLDPWATRRLNNMCGLTLC